MEGLKRIETPDGTRARIANTKLQKTYVFFESGVQNDTPREKNTKKHSKYKQFQTQRYWVCTSRPDGRQGGLVYRGRLGARKEQPAVMHHSNGVFHCYRRTTLRFTPRLRPSPPSSPPSP